MHAAAWVELPASASATKLLRCRTFDFGTLHRELYRGNALGRIQCTLRKWQVTADMLGGLVMANIRSTTGTVDVDGVTYDWQLEREPQWSDAEGWKGMTVSLLERDCRRAALLEFPAPKKLLKGLPRGRLQIDDPTICRGVRAALLAGWEPTSRGKPMVFTVDAEGN